jgi:hypothetical protein
MCEKVMLLNGGYFFATNSKFSYLSWFLFVEISFEQLDVVVEAFVILLHLVEDLWLCASLGQLVFQLLHRLQRVQRGGRQPGETQINLVRFTVILYMGASLKKFIG